MVEHNKTRKSKFSKLFLGHSVSIHQPKPAIKNQVYTILRIWRNYYHHDFGIERIIRLSLATAQFLSLGLYIKHVAGYGGTLSRKMATEAYVILKFLFPLICLTSGWYSSGWALIVTGYLMAETVLYLASLIFLSDVSRESIQPHRSLTLLFFNFFEIVGDFSLIYAYFNFHEHDFFNVPFVSIWDSIYFSFVTAATVGYGDIIPVATLCKQLAMVQITLTFVFVGLFLNFFSNLLFHSTNIDTKAVSRKTRHSAMKK